MEDESPSRAAFFSVGGTCLPTDWSAMRIRHKVTFTLDEAGSVLQAYVMKEVDGDTVTASVLSFEPFDTMEDVLGQVQRTVDFQQRLW